MKRAYIAEIMFSGMASSPPGIHVVIADLLRGNSWYLAEKSVSAFGVEKSFRIFLTPQFLSRLLTVLVAVKKVITLNSVLEGGIKST